MPLFIVQNQPEKRKYSPILYLREIIDSEMKGSSGSDASKSLPIRSSSVSVRTSDCHKLKLHIAFLIQVKWDDVEAMLANKHTMMVDALMQNSVMAEKLVEAFQQRGVNKMPIPLFA